MLCEKPEVKYAVMQENAGTFSITAQGLAFGVSRGGYYGWRHRLQNPCQRQMERKRLDLLVKEAFEVRKGRSGEHFTSRQGMRRAVFEYIEVDYNRNRMHSANGYISPLAFENQIVA